MAYMLALAIDERNKDLSPLAIIGALGDRQDSGPGRSLTGLNRKALEDAMEKGLVTVSKDFLFHGRETRPDPRGDSHDLHALHRGSLGGQGRLLWPRSRTRVRPEGAREVEEPRRALRRRRSRSSSRS